MGNIGLDEGLRVLAHLIANAHLATCKHNVTTLKATGGNGKNESISRTIRNKSIRKRSR